MVTFVFTKNARRDFLKLPKKIQERILLKLQELKQHHDILSVVRHLMNFEPATHRLRMGAYRLILQLKILQKNEMLFWILNIGHRKDVYR